MLVNCLSSIAHTRLHLHQARLTLGTRVKAWARGLLVNTVRATRCRYPGGRSQVSGTLGAGDRCQVPCGQVSGAVPWGQASGVRCQVSVRLQLAVQCKLAGKFCPY